MREQVDKVQLVTNALRDALTAYEKLDGPDQALVIVALFGVTQSKRLAPMLEEIAQDVQPGSKETK
jgi:hypothetical protein